MTVSPQYGSDGEVTQSTTSFMTYPIVLYDRLGDVLRHVFQITYHPIVGRALVRLNVLPIVTRGPDEYCLAEDIISLLPVFSNIQSEDDCKLLSWNMSYTNNPIMLRISQSTYIVIHVSNNVDSLLSVAVRNLISVSNSFSLHISRDKQAATYFSQTVVLTSSDNVLKFMEEQRARVEYIEASDVSQFSNSAYYMGSKRLLRCFLVEAVSSFLPKEGVVLDLMCGSGAASAAFSRIWRTFASDSQEFSKKLAFVQGGGFSVREAERLLSRILQHASINVSQLRERLHHFLKAEDAFFHSDIRSPFIEEYANFQNSFPLFPDGKISFGWDPVNEVQKRRSTEGLTPYCLFTAYFGNVYFGIRQCIEIDSLRFGIDALETSRERDFALGALIATISALGTTYAGHFAQPVKLTEKNLSDYLEKRAHSIMHEFSVRLSSLAKESERTPHTVQIVAGPWLKSIASFEELKIRGPVAVYIDAPYKREEYSRYYHILETLVTYTYPSSTGIGKVPEKGSGPGKRFSSEFFTRKGNRLLETFVQIISESLKRGWTCVWSYSDSGDVDIIGVLERVYRLFNCKIRSFSTPFQHKPHGGRKSKKVIEYLFVFHPNVDN